MDPLIEPTYAEAQMQALANAAANYFLALVAKGLTRQEALTITCTWVASLVSRAKS